MMRGKGYLFKWYVALFLVFLYAPAILLPVFAFNDSSIVSQSNSLSRGQRRKYLWATSSRASRHEQGRKPKIS